MGNVVSKREVLFVIERILSDARSYNTPTRDLMTLHFAYNLVGWLVSSKVKDFYMLQRKSNEYDHC